MAEEYEPELTRLKRNLQAIVSAYSQHMGLKESTALMSVLKSQQPRLIYIDDEADLRAGRYDKWMQDFSNIWPANLAWPAEIVRPPVQDPVAAD